MLHEVGEDLSVAGTHDRALGHRDDEIAAARAVALAALPVLARLGAPVRMVAEREQRRGVAVGPHDHVAAVAAVAAVGPALRHVRLAPERHRARAAVTTAEVALDLVDERGLHETSLRVDADAARVLRMRLSTARRR